MDGGDGAADPAAQLAGAGLFVVEVGDVLVPLLAAETSAGDCAGPVRGVIAEVEETFEVGHGDGAVPAADRQLATIREEDQCLRAGVPPTGWPSCTGAAGSLTSRSATEPPDVAVASRRPSGENAMETDAAAAAASRAGPTRDGFVGSPTFHKITVPLSLPVARSAPLGENATDATTPRNSGGPESGPLRRVGAAGSLISHTLSVLS